MTYQDGPQSTGTGSDPGRMVTMDTEEGSLREAPAREACPLHPEATVVQHCNRCSAGVCATCDFEFAGGIHLCPTCATTEDTRLSAKRRQLAAWSIGLGIWGAFAFVMFFVLAAGIEDEKELESLGTAYSTLGLLPCLIGAALGFSAFDRRLHNPRWLWVAPVTSTTIVVIMIVLIIVGSTAE